MLWGARRVTIRVSAYAPVPLDSARVVWGDGDRLDLPRDQMALLQAGAVVELSHVYALATTPYLLQVTVEDTDGQQASASASVLVTNHPPCLTLAVEVVEQAVTITPSATDSDGEVIDITLYWGGREGMAAGLATDAPVTHQYPAHGGLWNLLATATDDEGASTAVHQYVAILSDEEAATTRGNSPGARYQERNTTT
ncbi:MAG: hypothetical protein ACYDBB_01615 [Armatimonadota bacterium]